MRPIGMNARTQVRVRTRRPVRRILLTVAGVAFAFGGLGPARAACTPPSLELSSRRADVGDRLTVTGDGWFPCESNGGGGCFSRPVHEGIVVELRGPRTDQTKRDIENQDFGETRFSIELLQLEEPDDEGRFEIEMTVPDVPPGEYFVTGSAVDDGSSIGSTIVSLSIE